MRKRRRVAGGQDIDRTTTVPAFFVRIIPCSLRNRRNTLYNPVADFYRQQCFPAVIVHPYRHAVRQSACLRVLRVHPDALRVQYRKGRVFVVNRMTAALGMPSNQLERVMGDCRVGNPLFAR